MPSESRIPASSVMDLVTIRAVEQYPEPEFSQLQRKVFSEIQQSSAALAATLEQESSSSVLMKHVHAPMHRLGAYVGDELVGWSCGWLERGGIFYMATSGVVTSYRRQGLYTSLLSAIQDHASSVGAIAIRSQHSVLNNAVLIAKLKAGFHISGLSVSAHMGTLVELTFHFHLQRHEMFRSRVLPYVVPDA